MHTNLIKNYLLVLLLTLFLIRNLPAQDRGLDIAVKKLDPNTTVGKQWLVIIGISKYQRWPNLMYPVKDAGELKDILLQRYYIDKVVELYNQDATKAGIIKLLVDMQQNIGLNDSLLIYYAGHGHFDKNSNSSFWIPHDAGIDEYVQDNWLPHSQIRGLIKNIKSIHICLISDACFSGDIIDITRAKPENINNQYFKKAYTRISRQVLTSGESEKVPDRSEFSYLLKLALGKNSQPYLDPLMLYNEIRLGVTITTPLLGNLKATGHQEGASFILFLKDSTYIEEIPDSEPVIISKDLGTVHYTEAPKTWYVEIPPDYERMEIAHYSKGKSENNKYMGWAGYLKVNNSLVWQFLDWDQQKGGLIHDYVLGRDVLEKEGRNKYIDITGLVKAGRNSITYYHYTSGDGIGVKYRIIMQGD